MKDMKYVVGIVGTPIRWDIEWSDGNLAEMKRLGFNTLQLNIAWGFRPGDEPLNLEDVLVTEGMENARERQTTLRRSKISGRLKQCKKHGFRSIFHFGAPYNGEDGYLGKPLLNCVSDKEVRQRYVDLLFALGEQIPGIDDILVYTYDQDAWLCSEFGGCGRCFGVPLHERLPAFLDALAEAWWEISPDGVLWWEPWELSAGQVYETVKRVGAKNIGLSLHSNIGEVQKTRAVDRWFKNTARLAAEKNMPVIAELFLGQSCEETEPLKRIPAPRLTFDQVGAVRNVYGISGIKEYYGDAPNDGDPCLEMVGCMLREPGKSAGGYIEMISAPYGKAAAHIQEMWESAARGYELYPWDVSWYAREAGRANIDHGWDAAFLRGQQCSTPSWESSRHSVFMKTDDCQPHPWMLEDIQLRCAWAAELLEKAAEQGSDALDCLAGKGGKEEGYIREAVRDLSCFARVCRSYELHLRETNVAELIRESFRERGGAGEALFEEMRRLLERDRDNQNGNHRSGNKGNKRVEEMLRLFDKDRYAWVMNHLLPPGADSIGKSAGGRVSDDMMKNAFSLTTR